MRHKYRVLARRSWLILIIWAIGFPIGVFAQSALTLLQPTYNCQSGAFTFNTTGGDGSPITYRAPGITNPTTNPNQFVDAGLRQAADVKPFLLSATQGNTTVTYTWDLRAQCPLQSNPDIGPLVDLYNATNGPNWTNKTNWLTGASPCNWYGVSCDGNGRVVGLNIGYNNLNGTLPASLGNLSQLKSLVFFTEPLLSGSIPASLGNLSQLETLEIEYTQLSGAIPASLGNLMQLKSLFLAQNQLSGSIPASLGILSQLQSLFLFGNQLSGCFPAALSTLCGKDIRTYNNVGLPGGGDFASFCVNKTGVCPPVGSSLVLTAPTYNCSTGAITFNISGGDGSPITYRAPGITNPTTNPNQFVDAGLRQAADVKPFLLSATQGNTTVTYTWDLRAQCPLQSNPDMGPLVDLYNATNGPNWTNKTNWLTGTSPCNWYGVSCDGNGRVVGLNIGYNNLNGTLPASLGNLSQLKSLVFFTEPLLSGSIPASLGNLSQLETLEIEYTQLSGAIPASLGNLMQLKSLFLAQNQLSGSIPASLGSLSQLQSLFLFGNQLSGCFPTALSTLCGKDIRTYNNVNLPGGGDFASFCANKTGACSAGSFALISPTYNCQTGAFTFNTMGGDGSPISFRAPGITNPTTNPNQFVDVGLRQAADVKPFLLSATQGNTTVTYTWDLKAACGRARVATELGTGLLLQVLGNPAREQVGVLITGVEGQTVQLRLMDVRGQLLESRVVEQAKATEEQYFRLEQAGPGLLLLQASTESQLKSVKIVRQ